MTRFIQQEQREPVTCTLELRTGRFIHVEHTPSEVKVMVAKARDKNQRSPAADDTFIRVTRVSGTHSRTTRGFLDIDIAWSEIVVIHPLQSRGEIE